VSNATIIRDRFAEIQGPPKVPREGVCDYEGDEGVCLSDYCSCSACVVPDSYGEIGYVYCHPHRVMIWPRRSALREPAHTCECKHCGRTLDA